MQQTIVRFVGKLYLREMIGQKNAPAMPEDVAVMERMAIGTVPIFSSVRAKRIAVPDTVATASESINHAMRKMTIWRSLTATLTVFHTEPQANIRYATTVRSLEGLERAVMRGGPGRGCIHSETGTVKQNHHRPTINRTMRRASVDEFDVLDIR